jgi:hypothetical protein
MVTGSTLEWISTIVGVVVLSLVTWATVSLALGGAVYVVACGVVSLLGDPLPLFWPFAAVSGAVVAAPVLLSR